MDRRRARGGGDASSSIRTVSASRGRRRSPRSRSSESGELVAIATSEAGSDWRTWTVRDVRDRGGAARPDLLEQVRHRGLDPRRRRLLLRPLPGARRGRRLRRARTGTWRSATTASAPARTEDRLVLRPRRTSRSGGSSPRSPTMAGCSCSASGAAPIPRTGSTSPTSADGVDAAVVRPLLDEADAAYEPIVGDRRGLYLLTDRDAPLGRVIAVDVDASATAARDHPRGRRRARAGAASSATGSRSSTSTMPITGCRSSSSMGATSSTWRCPGSARSCDMAGRRGDAELFLTFDDASGRRRRSWPSAWRTAPSATVGRPALAVGPGSYVTEQVFVTAADGTRVPLFLTRRRDVAPDGEVPTLLYGYGGFQIAIGPDVQAGVAGLDGAGRAARGRVAARGGGVRHGLARRRATRQQAERVRRLRRLRPVAGGVGLDPAGADRDQRALQRRPAGRGEPHPAPGALRRGRRRGGRDGHAALPPLHHRLGLDQRLRLRRRPGAVPHGSWPTRRSTTSGQASRTRRRS